MNIVLTRKVISKAVPSFHTFSKLRRLFFNPDYRQCCAVAVSQSIGMPKYRRLFGPLLASEQVCSAIAVVVIATISHVCVADQASYEGVEEDAWQRQLENSLGATLAKTVGVDAS